MALLLTHAASPPATAQTASLEKCRSLQERIERYTRLRRKGGSASQMDSWKRQLRKSEEQFREYGCREFGRELR